MAPADQDPLLLLRQSIASGSAIMPTASTDASAPEVSLSQATHLTFTSPTRTSLPISTPTRFVSNETPVDLRSIYFAWLNREVAIPEYNSFASQLNQDLGGKGQVHKFAYIEKLDLITWLEGASEESECIKPLAGDKDGSASTAAAALASKGAAAPAVGSALGRSGKGTLDPRLASIYNSERKMGDRNSVLRGIKPTDFSHVRKLATLFMTKKPLHPSSSNVASNPAIASHQKQKRPDPIILLSPSASSLLRMSNIKSFLDGCQYVPPNSLTATSSTTANMLHINRLMKDIDTNRPMRFILVEGTEQFKPEYWNRVVAVFTTGQTWQFKNYKWSNPTELFRHVPGIYVGWRGEQPPESVRAWGHRVMNVAVDRWKNPGTTTVDSSRWRDREAVEGVWKAIESNMRAKGWKRDQAPSSI
ncbi:RNA pol II accessory factor, Cdc73 family-domain-containing protein [Hypoxylon argillaceum]|nr:RNA pol II accessory factor, Cdc73 family-domain-containing protein [Hypoxylon argillaceum]KAI1153903.1 RNA pol II accessory factor, Cdc73 family-domain-containing protein [Nemania diffusa]